MPNGHGQEEVLVEEGERGVPAAPAAGRRGRGLPVLPARAPLPPLARGFAAFRHRRARFCFLLGLFGGGVVVVVVVDGGVYRGVIGVGQPRVPPRVHEGVREAVAADEARAGGGRGRRRGGGYHDQEEEEGEDGVLDQAAACGDRGRQQREEEAGRWVLHGGALQDDGSGRDDEVDHILISDRVHACCVHSD